MYYQNPFTIQKAGYERNKLWRAKDFVDNSAKFIHEANLFMTCACVPVMAKFMHVSLPQDLVQA